ncbi:MAG: gliding motility-associated C-terminal domain-containing protein [Bacteroidetes bacterium]|nr:gliding motility-associated C-terminal domain-containing protein [Bacteroidota bacterium]
MKRFKHFVFFIFCFTTSASIAQRGIDGNRIVSAAGTIVNEYTTLTADAAAGATTITVAASGLNANTRFGAGNNLAAGDLIMIIQMQGVSSSTSSSIEFPAGSGQFYGFPNDLTWGQITSYNNCGNYEFCQVRSVPTATTITIDCGLKNPYTSAGRVQVIRVPRYNTLTINSGGVLTCPAWAAGGIYTGGIVAVEVYGATVINAGGSITSTGLGFRGGSRVGDNVTTLGGGQVARNDATEGAEKGEGVFGYQADYNVIAGRFCRGAAGNAGGGGDAHNAGGGGGANAGTGVWDGEGNPDVSGGAGWIAAWNRDISVTFATHVSSGGGRGGYSFSSANRDATLEGPKPFQAAGSNLWGGDFRINNGGWGGRPLDYSTGKIFLGGGGGAGDQENNCGGSGGNGGGMVYIMSYGTISGAGTITANGAAGSNTTSSGVNFGIDAAGGGGGGGTIILNSIGTVSGITAAANGGVGGNQDVLPAVNEAEGPGGGGGGGYIAISTGVITATVNGGANGTTDSNAMTEFPPNGATRGGAGLTNQPISADTINVANTTICSGNTATLTANLVGSIPGTITWYSAQVAGTVLGTGATFTTPTLSTTTTYYVGFCPGTYTIPVTVTVNTSPTTSAAGLDQTVCATSATFAGNPALAGTGTWTLISGAGTITTPSSPTSAVTGLGLGANVFQWTITNPPCGTSTDQVTITSTGGPTTSVAGTAQTVCGTSATLAGNTPTTGTGTWTLVSGAGTITTPSSPTSGVTGLGVGPNVFQWSIASAPCPPSTSTVTITGVTAPTTANAGTPQTVCGTSATLAGNTATTGTGTWTLVSGAGTITTPSSPTSGVTGLGVGPNVFQWSIANAPCPASTSTVTITGVAAPTTANAGSAQTVCGTTATLAGNTATTGTGTWTLVSGAGTITTPSSPTSGITGLGVGPNVFQWSITNAPCVASNSTVTITGVAAPTTANAGTPQTVCGTTATLAGNTATTGTGTWTLVSGAGTITTPSSPTSGVTGLGVGPNIFQWSIANAPCPASTSTVTITGVAAPTTANAGTPQTVCGTTATLAGNTATTGTGTWTLVSGAGTITTPSSPTSGITGLGVGPNVFQWSITNAPCVASTSTVTITGVASPTAANAGTPQTICGTTATLAGNTPTTGTGTWTLVSGAGTITTPSSPTSGITGLGVGPNVFQWSITNAPCPASTSTVTITGTTAADATISSVTPICLGTPAFNLTAATAGGAWTGTGITSGASGTFNPATAGVGTYTITYTISGACGNVDTTIVTVLPNDDATISPIASLCVSATPTNLVAATVGGTWSGTGITDAVNGTFDPAVAGIGSYTITYSTPGICGSTDTVIVTVNSSSDATITSIAPICTGSSAFNLTAATAGGVWSGTGITSGATGTFDPTIAGIGVHIITYTISGTCGATDTASINVTAAANATITAISPICASTAPFNLTAANSGGTWSGTGITDPINGTFNPSLATPGVNTITYSISGACGDTATTTITVNALPVPTFTADVTSGCEPLCVTFNESATNTCTSMSYDFGDGNTSASSTFTNCYTSPGTYSVSITCTDANGCVGLATVTNMITVSPRPLANFTVSPSGVLPVGSTAVFTDISTNGGISFWNFGDPTSASNTSILTSDSHMYADAGIYCVLLIAGNTGGCVDSITICVDVADDATINTPNVFTPNNDGANDIFYFLTTSVKELNCSVYDRWGLKIAEWTSLNDAINGWDGRTTSGLIAPDGVYYYIMKANTANEKVIDQTGFIHLLKEK